MALSNLLRAALGSLPLIPRGDRIPDRTLVIDEGRVVADGAPAEAVSYYRRRIAEGRP